MLWNMKILTIASPWMGGSGSVGFQIARYLKKVGFESYFLSYNYPFKYIKNDKNNPSVINVHPLNYPLFPFPLYELTLAEEIAKKVLEHKIDIIHSHYGILFGHAAILAREAVRSNGSEVKVINTFHGSDVLGFDLKNPGSVAPKLLNTMVVKQSDAITFVSKDLKDWAEKLYGTNQYSEIIPNSIDIKTYIPSKNFEPFNIIHISNYRPVKQATLIPDIFKNILQEIPQATLTLIGDGPEMPLIKKKIATYGLSNKVTYTGKLYGKSLITTIQKSGILLLPSLYESFSLVALEAQACGVPVVAAKVGGIADVLEDRKTGFLISDISNPDAYSKIIISYFKNTEQFFLFRDSARLQSEKFNEDEISDRYVELFKKLK